MRLPQASPRDTRPVPAPAGIGLRAPHYRELLEARPAVGFLEVHSENYFGGGAHAAWLARAREHYPLSLHGVGLSLGSTDPLSVTHLRRLKDLVERTAPALVSDHLCWSSAGGRFFNDLLPLPHTREAIAHLVSRIGQAQDFLRRPILVENLSSYLVFADGEMPEWEFVTEIARRAGCGLLLDVNNVYVAAMNHGFDPRTYLDAVPTALVQEMHLAGHMAREAEGGRILVDTHNAPVCEAVWSLYAHAVRRFGAVPTLVEWDQDLPALPVLVAEAARADAIVAAAAAPRQEDRHDLAA